MRNDAKVGKYLAGQLSNALRLGGGFDNGKGMEGTSLGERGTSSLENKRLADREISFPPSFTAGR